MPVCYIGMAIRSAGGGGEHRIFAPGACALPGRPIARSIARSYIDCEIASKIACKTTYILAYISAYIWVVAVVGRWILNLPAKS